MGVIEVSNGVDFIICNSDKVDTEAVQDALERYEDRLDFDWSTPIHEQVVTVEILTPKEQNK